MKDQNFYVWKDEQVHIVTDKNYEVIFSHFQNCFMVDNRFATNDLQLKFGMYAGRQNIDEWIHVPVENFPEEFRVQLLLLGVL